MSGDFEHIGQHVTITIRELNGSQSVTVEGDITTIYDALTLVEHALRGAGFYCPFESVLFEPPPKEAA